MQIRARIYLHNRACGKWEQKSVRFGCQAIGRKNSNTVRLKCSGAAIFDM